VPSFLIGAAFPQIMGTRWMLVIGFMIFIGTEAIAWVVLFNKDLKAIAHRLRDSHQQFAAIKDHMIEIKDNLSDVAEYVVKGDDKSEEQNTKKT
jgi:hypothetical protein